MDLSGETTGANSSRSPSVAWWRILLPSIFLVLLGGLASWYLSVEARAKAELTTQSDGARFASTVFSRLDLVTIGLVDLASVVGLGDRLLTQADFQQYLENTSLVDALSIRAVGVLETVPRSDIQNVVDRERADGRDKFFVAASPLAPGDALVLSRFVVAGEEGMFAPNLGVDLSGFSETLDEIRLAIEPRSILLQRFDLEPAKPLLRLLGQEELISLLDGDLAFVAPARLRDGLPTAWVVGLVKEEALVEGRPQSGGIELERLVAGDAVTITRLGNFEAPVVAVSTQEGKGAEWRIKVHGDPVATYTAALNTLGATLAIALLTGLALWLRQRMLIQSEDNERLAQQALTDSLTGLANRDQFAMLMDEIRRDDKEKVAIIVGDLDGFKTLNDSHGHQAGDYMLRMLARRLRETVRPGDLVCRWGGDEFLVVLRNTNDHEANTIRQRLEEAVARPVNWEGRILQVGLSTGLTISEPWLAGEGSIRLADQRMYQAKSSRTYPDRVGFASQPN